VLRDALRMFVAGAGIALLRIWALARPVESQLPMWKTHDPATLYNSEIPGQNSPGKVT